MGNTLLIIVGGIFTALNLTVIIYKLRHSMYLNAFIDAALLVALAKVFGGSITGLMTATVASFFVSVYLFVSPPKIEEDWLTL